MVEDFLLLFFYWCKQNTEKSPQRHINKIFTENKINFLSSMLHKLGMVLNRLQVDIPQNFFFLEKSYFYNFNANIAPEGSSSV